MKLIYEAETDTLHIFAGDQTNSVARDEGDGVLIQISNITKKPVGAIIHDFKERFESERGAKVGVEIPVFEAA